MPILKEGTRILTPAEFDKIFTAITKSDYRTLLNTALFTGMRYVELQRFQKHPDWLLLDRKCIYLPKEAVKKAKRKAKTRYVHLTPAGISNTQMFFKIRNLPKVQQLNTLLSSWAMKAGIISTGITVKSTRKTWESWLVISYPDKIDLISMNQGHTNLTALRHYLQLPFSDEEIKEIKSRTAGWME